LAFGICYDPFFGIYITGATASTDFPTQLPLDNLYYQSVHGDGGNFFDMFVCWFNASGAMQWSTYYGDGNTNEGRALDTDQGSNIFVTGDDSNNVRTLKFAPYTTTGIVSEVAGTKLNIFPVPAQENINVEVEIGKEGYLKVEIMDIQGKSIKKEFVKGLQGRNVFSLDISQLPEGTYLLRMTDAEKARTTKFSKIK